MLKIKTSIIKVESISQTPIINLSKLKKKIQINKKKKGKYLGQQEILVKSVNHKIFLIEVL